MRPRNEPWSQLPTPFVKEPLELGKLFRRQGREPGKRRAPMAVERGGDAPHSSTPLAKLLLLCGAIFVESIGRVRDDCVHGACRPFAEPPERLGMKQGRTTKVEGWAKGFFE